MTPDDRPPVENRHEGGWPSFHQEVRSLGPLMDAMEAVVVARLGSDKPEAGAS